MTKPILKESLAMPDDKMRGPLSYGVGQPAVI